MWVLEHSSVVNSEAEGRFLLLPGKYVVGRLSSDILCQHASISRKHAEITVEKADNTKKGLFLSIKGKSGFAVCIFRDACLLAHTYQRGASRKAYRKG